MLLRQWRREGGGMGHHAPGAIQKGAPNGAQNKKFLAILYGFRMGREAKKVLRPSRKLSSLHHCAKG